MSVSATADTLLSTLCPSRKFSRREGTTGGEEDCQKQTPMDLKIGQGRLSLHH